MPHLPEAEANRRAIEAECLNRTIEDARPGDIATHLDLPGDDERARPDDVKFVISLEGERRLSFSTGASWAG